MTWRALCTTPYTAAKLHVSDFLAAYRGGSPTTDAAAPPATAAAAAPAAPGFTASAMSPRVPGAATMRRVKHAVVSAATVSPAPPPRTAAPAAPAAASAAAAAGLRASRSILTASMQSLATYSEGSPGGGGGGGAGGNPGGGESPSAASPAPSSASMEQGGGAEFSAFIREVAARVIQHYTRAWLAAPKPPYQNECDAGAENLGQFLEQGHEKMFASLSAAVANQTPPKPAKSPAAANQRAVLTAATNQTAAATSNVPPEMRSPYSMYSIGRAVQVDPIKPVLKAPGTILLKLRCDGPLSNAAFNSTCAATRRDTIKLARTGGGSAGGGSAKEGCGCGLLVSRVPVHYGRAVSGDRDPPRLHPAANARRAPQQHRRRHRRSRRSGSGPGHGKAVQVEPMKTLLKAPWNQALKSKM